MDIPCKSDLDKTSLAENDRRSGRMVYAAGICRPALKMASEPSATSGNRVEGCRTAGSVLLADTAPDLREM